MSPKPTKMYSRANSAFCVQFEIRPEYNYSKWANLNLTGWIARQKDLVYCMYARLLDNLLIANGYSIKASTADLYKIQDVRTASKDVLVCRFDFDRKEVIIPQNVILQDVFETKYKSEAQLRAMLDEVMKMALERKASGVGASASPRKRSDTLKQSMLDTKLRFTSIEHLQSYCEKVLSTGAYPAGEIQHYFNLKKHQVQKP